MRYAGFILFVLLLGAVEAALPQALRLDYVRPQLLVVLVFFFALRLNTIEGALLSLFCGFVQDAAGGYATGLAAFAQVSLFVGARLTLAALRAEGRAFETVFVFLLAAAFHLVTGATSRLFGPVQAPLASTPWLSVLLGSALASAAVSPLILPAVAHIERLGARRAEML